MTVLDSLTGPESPTGPESLAGPGWRDRVRGRGALVAFIALEVGAFPLLMVLGNRMWFNIDDWDFFAARTAGNLGDLFRPHFQHWVTLPVLAYRLLWQFFGMHHYAPYQAMVVLLHLAVVALIRVVMRRAGVRPWIATIMAVLLVFFGAGAENIVVAFQIAFAGAFAFGLAQLLLADHDGPIDRRDWWGLLAGFAGLMCSGIALTMTVLVGLAILLRRGRSGLKVALFHTAPLGVAYIVWSRLAPKGQSADIYRSHSIVPVIKFAWVGVSSAFKGLGRVPVVGIALGVVLIVGLVVASRALDRIQFRRELVPLLVLLVGAAIFLLVTGFVRAGKPPHAEHFPQLGPNRARESRYIYLIVAMILPALALAVDAIIRRWRLLTIPMLALVLAGLPGNIHQLRDYEARYPTQLPERESILSLARAPLADQLRDSKVLVQFPRLLPEGISLGWIVRSRSSLPEPRTLNDTYLRSQSLRFRFVGVNPPPGLRCTPLTQPVDHVVKKGGTITFQRGDALVQWRPPGSPPSIALHMTARTYKALSGPLALRVIPAEKGVELCF